MGEDQQWSITLGNTLLASIVCLLWYVFGLWEEKDKVGEESGTLTSAIEKKKVTRVDKEACTNGSTPGHLSSRPEEEEEQRLYMLPEQGRQLIIDQIKLRQEQSAMQLKEEKTSVEEEPKKRKTTSDVRNQTMTVFQWPQDAAVLECALPNTSSGLSNDFEDKLKDLGIFREGGDDDGISQVEGAAKRCGLELTRKQVRLSFDTFMAKSRPGLESDEEVKENSPKPKKRQNNNNNNNNKDKKMTEPVLRQERKEGKEKKTTRPRSTENNKGPIRTGGWSNPAWKIVQPQPSPALVRAF